MIFFKLKSFKKLNINIRTVLLSAFLPRLVIVKRSFTCFLTAAYLRVVLKVPPRVHEKMKVAMRTTNLAAQKWTLLWRMDPIEVLLLRQKLPTSLWKMRESLCRQRAKNWHLGPLVTIEWALKSREKLKRIHLPKAQYQYQPPARKKPFSKKNLTWANTCNLWFWSYNKHL